LSANQKLKQTNLLYHTQR